MRISDWSSDVCSSDLDRRLGGRHGTHVVEALLREHLRDLLAAPRHREARPLGCVVGALQPAHALEQQAIAGDLHRLAGPQVGHHLGLPHRDRSEEHTSELQSLMRISYAVFCLKKKKIQKTTDDNTHKST